MNDVIAYTTAATVLIIVFMLFTQNRASTPRPFEPFADSCFDRTKRILVITTKDGGSLYGTTDQSPTSEIFQKGVILHDAWKNDQKCFRASIIYTPGDMITSIGFVDPDDCLPVPTILNTAIK